MTDPRGKHVKVTDQERITELESPQGTTEVERSGSPQSIEDRMKELERELAQPNSELVVARSDSSSHSQPQETATASTRGGAVWQDARSPLGGAPAP